MAGWGNIKDEEKKVAPNVPGFGVADPAMVAKSDKNFSDMAKHWMQKADKVVGAGMRNWSAANQNSTDALNERLGTVEVAGGMGGNNSLTQVENTGLPTQILSDKGNNSLTEPPTYSRGPHPSRSGIGQSQPATTMRSHISPDPRLQPKTRTPLEEEPSSMVSNNSLTTGEQRLVAAKFKDQIAANNRLTAQGVTAPEDRLGMQRIDPTMSMMSNGIYQDDSALTDYQQRSLKHQGDYADAKAEGRVIPQSTKEGLKGLNPALPQDSSKSYLDENKPWSYETINRHGRIRNWSDGRVEHLGYMGSGPAAAENRVTTKVTDHPGMPGTPATENSLGTPGTPGYKTTDVTTKNLQSTGEFLNDTVYRGEAHKNALEVQGMQDAASKARQDSINQTGITKTKITADAVNKPKPRNKAAFEKEMTKSSIEAGNKVMNSDAFKDLAGDPAGQNALVHNAQMKSETYSKFRWSQSDSNPKKRWKRRTIEVGKHKGKTAFWHPDQYFIDLYGNKLEL